MTSLGGTPDGGTCQKIDLLIVSAEKEENLNFWGVGGGGFSSVGLKMLK